MARYLIIGVSSGIGKALSNMLLDKHEVIGISRSSPEINHANFSHHALDLSDESLQWPEIENLDGLVYCPGTIRLKPFHRISAEEFTADWNLNFLLATKALQQYYPALKKSDLASVVMFSTVAVQRGMPFHASVAGAKGAIEGFCRALAAEWAPTIRVNTIAPSLTNTPLASGLLNTEPKLMAAAERHPLKRIGEANDIANAAAWLLSPESSWVTGQVLKVDGGLSVI
jgi:3-oxoacyl-[acyl-carrier protein] reductase